MPVAGKCAVQPARNCGGLSVADTVDGDRMSKRVRQQESDVIDLTTEDDKWSAAAAAAPKPPVGRCEKERSLRFAGGLPSRQHFSDGGAKESDNVIDLTMGDDESSSVLKPTTIGRCEQHSEYFTGLSGREDWSGGGDTVRKRMREEESNNSVINLIEDDESTISRGNIIKPRSEQFSQCFSRYAYRVEFSILCLVRKLKNERKYPSLSVTVGDEEIKRIGDIVLRWEQNCIRVAVNYVEKYYTDCKVDYGMLFNELNRNFWLNRYFNSFVERALLPKSGGSSALLDQMEYLIICTNASLDLTKDKTLNRRRFKYVKPYQFENVNEAESVILSELLFTSGEFYRFSRGTTITKKFKCFLRNVQLSAEVEEGLKKEFLSKLIFAVNQPSREELNKIAREEANAAELDFMALRKRVSADLATSKKCYSQVGYKFSVLECMLHDLYSCRHMLSLNLENKNYSACEEFSVNYRGRITYLKLHNTSTNIGYDKLFPSGKRNDVLSVEKLFTSFLENSVDVRYFIVYTNANLKLSEQRRLKTVKSSDCYPFKFEAININEKRYKIFKHCSCINPMGLYRFSKEEATREKLVTLLKQTASLQQTGRQQRDRENGRKIIECFLDRLIFAVNQPDVEGLDCIVQNQMEQYDSIPYNRVELCEIISRWLVSHKCNYVSKDTMRSILEDIKLGRLSWRRMSEKNIDDEIRFAKSVVSSYRSAVFNEVLSYLVEGEGANYLAVLKKNGIKLFPVYYALSGSGSNAIMAFKNLYDLWFDAEGRKTRYLTTLENECVSLGNMLSILGSSQHTIAESFKVLFDLWFDAKGRKTQYLKNLEKEGIKLSTVCWFLKKSGVRAAEAFRDLHDLWFDKEGNKTVYLSAIEKNQIKLSSMLSIIVNTNVQSAVEVYRNLYNLWFDDTGKPSQYLETLKKESVSLTNLSSILHCSSSQGPQAFKKLYELWFDADGNKTMYLKNLEKAQIKLRSVASMLSGAGQRGATAFKDLYNFWFDAEGSKTRYLKFLENNPTYFCHMSNILNRAEDAEIFKELHDLWFDEEGQPSRYLKTLETEGIKLTNASSILGGSGVHAATAFLDLYNLWFDTETGKRTRYLGGFEENGISITSMSIALFKTGPRGAVTFKHLHELCFDVNGNKSVYVKALEEIGITLREILASLRGTRHNAPKAFKDLYDEWFSVTRNEPRYLRASLNMLRKKKVGNAFFDDRGNRNGYLKHFTEDKNVEKRFALSNLFIILNGVSGDEAVNAFKDLHNVCFDENGDRTSVLNDLHEAGFVPDHLSVLLRGTGVDAATSLTQFHRVCFGSNGRRRRFLKDFLETGFTPYDLCNLLSGTTVSVDQMKRLHYICFATPFLDHLLRGSFTPNHLCDILHGAGDTVCAALEEFHDACFDARTGKRTKLVNDLRRAGFKLSTLSSMLTTAGKEAASILRSFHRGCCVEKEFRLDYFLAEKEQLFTPEALSKILRGAGFGVYVKLEGLRKLCFDETGRRTEYLEELIANNSHSEIHTILYERLSKMETQTYDDDAGGGGSEAGVVTGRKRKNSSTRGCDAGSAVKRSRQ